MSEAREGHTCIFGVESDYCGGCIEDRLNAKKDRTMETMITIPLARAQELAAIEKAARTLCDSAEAAGEDGAGLCVNWRALQDLENTLSTSDIAWMPEDRPQDES